MGITERHWFEDEEPELTERQLEDAVSIQDRVYRRGYIKGYSDRAKEQKEKMEHLNNITLEYEKEVFRLQTLLKKQEARIEKYEYLFHFLGVGFKEWTTKILNEEAEVICETDEHERKTVITFKLI